MEFETTFENDDKEILGKELIKDYLENFDYPIVQRGKDYYYNGNVQKCIKCNNEYKAIVKGSSANYYNVFVEIDELDDFIDFTCDCPCDYDCKHEYAVLLAILDHNYEERDLKEEIEEQKEAVAILLNQIPAEEIKAYLLSDKGIKNVTFNEKEFSDYFYTYLPKQSYEYYYNNLYNALVMDNTVELIKSYFGKIKKYISNFYFDEAFKIVKAVINAYNDSKSMNNEDFIDNIAILGMCLRVIYRKSSGELRKDIDTWIQYIKDNDYYNNYYLEDILLMMGK